MFCIDAEYVLVFFMFRFFISLYSCRETYSKHQKTCSNKCHPFIRFHKFYGFMFFLVAKLARWNENVMVRFPNG